MGNGPWFRGRKKILLDLGWALYSGGSAIFDEIKFFFIKSAKEGPSLHTAPQREIVRHLVTSRTGNTRPFINKKIVLPARMSAILGHANLRGS